MSAVAPAAANSIAQGKSFRRSIVYGSLATPIKKPETDHTHRWTVYVRPYLETEDLTKYIKRVSFKLHESFAQPLRNVDQAPFEVQETGWGEFQIQIRITFQDPNQRAVTLNHHLRLYPPEDMGQLKTSRPVLSEFYDEICFEPATEAMAEVLEESQNESFTPGQGSKALALQQEEAKEIAHYDSVLELIKTQLDEVNAQLRSPASGVASAALPPYPPSRKKTKAS